MEYVLSGAAKGCCCLMFRQEVSASAATGKPLATALGLPRGRQGRGLQARKEAAASGRSPPGLGALEAFDGAAGTLPIGVADLLGHRPLELGRQAVDDGDGGSHLHAG